MSKLLGSSIENLHDAALAIIFSHISARSGYFLLYSRAQVRSSSDSDVGGKIVETATIFEVRSREGMLHFTMPRLISCIETSVFGAERSICIAAVAVQIRQESASVRFRRCECCTLFEATRHELRIVFLSTVVGGAKLAYKHRLTCIVHAARTRACGAWPL